MEWSAVWILQVISETQNDRINKCDEGLHAEITESSLIRSPSLNINVLFLVFCTS